MSIDPQHHLNDFPPALLAALEREKWQREKPIESIKELQEEILKVLIFSLAFQSESFRGQTAEELESVKERAIQRFQTDPMFGYFIKNQVAQIMQIAMPLSG